MDLETLKKGNDIQQRISYLDKHLGDMADFVAINGKDVLITLSDGDRSSIHIDHDFLPNLIDTYISNVKAEIKRLEQEFEDLQPPAPILTLLKKVQPSKYHPHIGQRLEWLKQHHFILSDGTHSSADGKVKSNYNDFIIKIGRELIIASPELINDFNEYTDLAGNVTSRWNTMVQKYHEAVKAYKESV